MESEPRRGCRRPTAPRSSSRPERSSASRVLANVGAAGSAPIASTSARCSAMPAARTPDGSAPPGSGRTAATAGQLARRGERVVGRQHPCFLSTGDPVRRRGERSTSPVRPGSVAEATARRRCLLGELGAVQVGVEPARGRAARGGCPARRCGRRRRRGSGRRRDRGQPVGDHQRGPAGAGPSSRARWTAASDSESRCAVASSRTTSAGALEQQAGDGEPLLLAAGQPVAAVAHDGLEALGQVERSGRRSGRPQRLRPSAPRWRRGGRSAGWPGWCRGTGARPGSPRRRRRARRPGHVAQVDAAEADAAAVGS